VTSKPIALADWGSFHVGGREVAIAGRAIEKVRFTSSVTFDWDPNGHYRFEHAYVQYFIPAEIRGLPLLLQHGGGLSGTMWETTPDGRPGWARLFVEAGHPVYVIDGVERGRANWCPFPDVWEGSPVLRSAEEAWSLFRFGRAEDFAARHAFPGQRFPVEAFDAFLPHFAPRWASNNARAQAALIAAVDRIGRCVIIGHSQGGEHALVAALARPDLVAAYVGIEPSGFPEPTRETVAARPFLFVLGDFLDATPLWTGLVAKIDAYAAALASVGARSEVWRLTGLGLPGHSHMPMMDHGSDALAARLVEWLGSAD
jgi:pimeloyl-ACP methyl ester carboxylesterase